MPEPEEYEYKHFIRLFHLYHKGVVPVIYTKMTVSTEMFMFRPTKLKSCLIGWYRFNHTRQQSTLYSGSRVGSQGVGSLSVYSPESCLEQLMRGAYAHYDHGSFMGLFWFLFCFHRIIFSWRWLSESFCLRIWPAFWMDCVVIFNLS